MEQTMNIQEDIMGYISKAGRIPVNEMNPNVRIYNSGIISSLRLIELMSYIEKQYSCTIKPEELVESNFKDVGTIVAFIRSKVEGSSGSNP
jgi:acyl carrier protein